ncbi:hypothetical protein DFH09DRAFT_1087697 [Mycena vulgaris]|nr:hypothetical protein DFH09DRAFT_1087697 [Mycena vulgaris]
MCFAAKAGSTLQSITGTTSPDPHSGRKELQLKPETGFTAIVFALLKLLREVGGRVLELSLDSAWNTNGSWYEVYAFLGKVFGCRSDISSSNPHPGSAREEQTDFFDNSCHTSRRCGKFGTSHPHRGLVFFWASTRTQSISFAFSTR